jgi:hypothetical protein
LLRIPLHFWQHHVLLISSFMHFEKMDKIFYLTAYISG